MIELSTAPSSPVEDLSSGGLLARARAMQVAAQEAETGLLAVAFEWALAHPADERGAGAAFRTGPMSDFEPIAGEGCPEVDDHAPAELGAVLGLSTTAAKRLIGHALELRCRLPRLWAGVRGGAVPVWRARSVAEATIHAHPPLTPAAAGWVDAQVAAVAGKVGPAQLERVVAEAIHLHGLTVPRPEDDPEDGWVHVNPRHVTFEEGVHFAGTMSLTAELDIADALDLDHAVRAGAAELRALGSEESLDARRSAALGALARQQTALRLDGLGGGDGASSRAGAETPARVLDLHVHVTATPPARPGADDASDVRDGTRQWVFGPTATLDEGQRLTLLTQVQDWCRDSRTVVRILPVLDLGAEITSTGYAPSPRLRRQVQLRDRTCVFPWCARPARRCDLDHVEPYAASAPPGSDGPPQTRTTNLGTLCRHHHRLKTHAGWRVTTTTNGVFEWTSPHGHQFRRDRQGTTRLEPPEPPGPPGPPAGR